MNIRIKIQSIPFILLAFVMSGCAGGCNRGYVSEHSLQGKELKAILEESRKIDVATPADWPIQFDSVAIDKKTDTEKVSYRAVLVWRLTGLQDVVRPQLQKLMKNHSPTEELPEWEATRLEVQLQFKNQNGEAVGKQSATLKLDGNEGKIILTELGKKGSPYSLDAEIVGFTVVERGEIPVSIVGDAPFQIDPIKVSKISTSVKSRFESRLKWSLNPNSSDAKMALLKLVAQTNSDAKVDDLQNAVLEVEYKNSKGETSREKVKISLKDNGGEASLPGLGKSGIPTTIAVKLISVELAGNTIDVSSR